MVDASGTQLLKGVLPMLVLRLLADHESYGYELVTRLRDAGLTEIAPGTVYPVLNRLEREGHVRSRLVPSSSGPARKYYLPTASGHTELAAARRAWTDLVTVVRGVLADADDDVAAPDPAAGPAPDPAPEETS